jgi:3,4-dehydroadipyl-CoA semialdehyde dehydrogenase
MSELLANFVGGQWQLGSGSGTSLHDPVLGDELVRVDATGLNLQEAFQFSRKQGGRALRALGYQDRAGLLKSILEVLQAKKDFYYEISQKNSGTVKNDSAVDIEGALFTLGYYAKLGQSLENHHFLKDGDPARLAKDPLFQSQHILTPTPGVALLINAFNFPAWGLWEKAAPALLSGVPVIIKPATATAWLTHQMVKDVIEANILPAGALSIICGSSNGLLDQLKPFDVVSFTGSADTAKIIRSHPAVTQHSVRVNIEADSVNSALLLPQQTGGPVFDLFIKEVVREMTVKSGQKCTAIRRIFVPESDVNVVKEALVARLAKTTVGNPRNESVRMGALVSHSQKQSVLDGIARFKEIAQVFFDGSSQNLIDVDDSSCCVAPTLFGFDKSSDAILAKDIHQTEVFGPVATILPYENLSQALEMIAMGEGSLVASVYGDEVADLAQVGADIAAFHGRLHIISSDVGAMHSGHGNVMPQSIHGGPGRAGGGEELGGLRGLSFYHRRTAIQASTQVIEAMFSGSNS